MNPKDLPTYYAGGRIGIGLLILFFPGRVLQGMLGGRHAVTPAVKLLGRMLGIRDAILGIGALAGTRPGSDASPATQRAWLRYATAADATDALAMLLAYGSLPKRKRFAMVLLALSGAGTGAYLLRTIDV